MSTDESFEDVFIDGVWSPAASTTFTAVIDPSTEEVVAQVVMADSSDVDRAVRAARAALPKWAATPVAERVRHLEALADVIAARADAFTSTITTENGTPVRESSAAAPHAAAFLRSTAEMAPLLEREDVRANPVDDARTLVKSGPIGVVGVITPWNFPLSLIIVKLGPALLAGCTVVVKPAPETPLAARLLAQACADAGLPPGVVNLVTGDIAAGEALVAHPGVDKVTFTGSTAAGRRIGEVCGRSLTPVTLELGGKSAAVVLDDADPEVFAANLIKTTLRNTGQTCKASTRLILPRTRSDEFLDVVRRVLDDSPVGDPRDPATVFGPLVSARQRERVEEYLQLGRDEGATFVRGGGRPPGLDRGFYVEPTVLTDVSPTSRLAQEEIFGPVLVVFEHDGDDDAVRQANDSVYGLAGAVFSSDPDRALDVACRIETGTVGINHYGSNMTAPFSGHKDSGLGTDFGPEGLAQYRVLTSIHLRGRAA